MRKGRLCACLCCFFFGGEGGLKREKRIESSVNLVIKIFAVNINAETAEFRGGEIIITRYEKFPTIKQDDIPGFRLLGWVTYGDPRKTSDDSIIFIC